MKRLLELWRSGWVILARVVLFFLILGVLSLPFELFSELLRVQRGVFSKIFIAAAFFCVALLALPFAAYLVAAIWRGTAGRELNPLLQRTAQLHLVFGSLLALGLLL